MGEENKTEDLSQPPIIDIEALLAPISDESPSGEYLRYSGIYDEINEERREDDALAIGDAGTLKTANFKKVIDLSIATLTKQSKDLQIVAWLAEALIKEHGWVGLRDGLKLMSGLQDEFWESLYPEIDEGDMEGRANAIAWFDREAAFAIKYSAITVDGYGLAGLEDSKRFDIPDSLDALGTEEKKKVEALKAQVKKENRTTTAQWTKAVAQSRRAFYEELNVTIEECKAEIKELDRVVEERFDRNQAPGLSELKKQIETIQRETNKLLELRRSEEPDPLDEDELDGSSGSASGEKSGAKGSSSGVVQNRRDALKKLAQLAEFFKRTEPHSPVSYLINRAVRWGNMPLESWLQDVIKDPNILGQIRQTLGFNTTADASESPSPQNQFNESDPPQDPPGGGLAPLQ